jgi:hypothetical protein
VPQNPDDTSAALLRHPYGIVLVGSRDGDDDHIKYVGEVLGGAIIGEDPAWTLQELGWEYGG